MFKIKLKNDVSFICVSESTIFKVAKQNNINLEHSCFVKVGGVSYRDGEIMESKIEFFKLNKLGWAPQHSLR